MSRDQNAENEPNKLRSGARTFWTESSRYKDWRKTGLTCIRSRKKASVTGVLVIKKERGKKRGAL